MEYVYEQTDCNSTKTILTILIGSMLVNLSIEYVIGKRAPPFGISIHCKKKKCVKEMTECLASSNYSLLTVPDATLWLVLCVDFCGLSCQLAKWNRTCCVCRTTYKKCATGTSKKWEGSRGYRGAEKPPLHVYIRVKCSARIFATIDWWTCLWLNCLNLHYIAI